MYIYIYIIFLTYLYSYSITTLYHNVVSKNVFVFSMFDCLLRQRMCCHGNLESFHKWRLRTKRTHEDSPRNRSTNSTSTDFGKSSSCLLLGICIGIAYSSLVSLATVIRVLKPEQKVKYLALQYSKNQPTSWNLKDMLLDTYSRLNLPQLYCNP